MVVYSGAVALKIPNSEWDGCCKNTPGVGRDRFRSILLQEIKLACLLPERYQWGCMSITGEGTVEFDPRLGTAFNFREPKSRDVVLHSPAPPPAVVVWADFLSTIILWESRHLAA